MQLQLNPYKHAKIIQKKTRLYREFKDMEKALLYHIHIALEEKYIDHLVDKDTGLLEDDIPTVMEYLPKNYGKVPSKEVQDKLAEVMSITFNPADQMVTLYSPPSSYKSWLQPPIFPTY